MSGFRHTLGREQVIFTDHALDRWWERVHDAYPTVGRNETLNCLRRWLIDKKIDRQSPPWFKATVFERARTYGYITGEVDGVPLTFTLVRDPDGSRVATTCVVIPPHKLDLLREAA